ASTILVYASAAPADTLTITDVFTSSGLSNSQTWTNVQNNGLYNQYGYGPWQFSAGLTDNNFWLSLRDGGSCRSQIQITITDTSDTPFPGQFGQLVTTFTGGFNPNWLINEWVSVNNTPVTPTISFYGGGVSNLTLTPIVDYGLGPYSVSATFVAYTEGAGGTLATGYGEIGIGPVASVRGPIVGAGIPGLIFAGGLLATLARRKKRLYEIETQKNW